MKKAVFILFLICALFAAGIQAQEKERSAPEKDKKREQELKRMEKTVEVVVTATKTVCKHV